MISKFARFLTGIEIHPAAEIAPGVFIDHGAGVVIGETAVVEKGVLIYQCVTLGGTGKDTGHRRHPVIKEGCVLSCGAKVLGGITVGEYSKIGAGSVVLKDVPPHSTVVGVPGRVVRIKGEKIPDNTPDKCDPILEELCNLRARVDELERKLGK
jgi:serine O-acetyltransferase